MVFRIIGTLIISASFLTVFAEPIAPQKSHRIPQFENEYVKVWKTVIMPNQSLSLHRHDSPRVIVGLKGGVLQRVEENGEISLDMNLETDKAYWYDEDPPEELHGDVNPSNEPIEVMVIEIKKPSFEK